MSFTIDRDTLTASLATMEPRIRVAVDLVFDMLASNTESQMMIDAPWTDRTGNARTGLRCIHESTGDNHTLTLFHTMEYGFWLEVAHDGKYAIIGPTQLRVAALLGPVVGAAVRRAMESAA
jgi:hypothetical protein